jgi:phospholipase C
MVTPGASRCTCALSWRALAIFGLALPISGCANLQLDSASAPAVTIQANPGSIDAGQRSTITVTASSATSVTVTGSDGSHYVFDGSGGTQSVEPSSSTTYVANAVNVGHKASARVTVNVQPPPPPFLSVTTFPSTITAGNPASLIIAANNVSHISVQDNEGNSYSVPPSGGTLNVTPGITTSYIVTADATAGNLTKDVTVTVIPKDSIKAINHIIFMLQENHSFDNYFGMLNPYRVQHGWNVGDDGNKYDVDGLEDSRSQIANKDREGDSYLPFKFASACVDEEAIGYDSAYVDVNPGDLSLHRKIDMSGFVRTQEFLSTSCGANSTCDHDPTGRRGMGHYDQDFLNYYYYMASQFAVSDRWFSPIASKTINNRIATFTGGTTQGLINPPGVDGLPQLDIPNIFSELDQAQVSWKIYYTVTQAFCAAEDECGLTPNSHFPDTVFSSLAYSHNFLYEKVSGSACVPPTVDSTAVGDSTGSFCIDLGHIAPLSHYFEDVANGNLPSFVFIEPGYGLNDEHPGYNASILQGQAQAAHVVNTLMTSNLWKDSVFFLSYDEGGGAFDHVPPVPGHSNDNTSSDLGNITDIGEIAVNADDYNPCLAPGGQATLHCDLKTGEPGAKPTDAPAVLGFAAQIGFRVPNIVISPFTRRHYVSHIPMDHTAVIALVEARFIGPTAHLTRRDAAQSNLLDFFDFAGAPWTKPPDPPAPVTASTLGYDPCTPGTL